MMKEAWDTGIQSTGKKKSVLYVLYRSPYSGSPHKVRVHLLAPRALLSERTLKKHMLGGGEHSIKVQARL